MRRLICWLSWAIGSVLIIPFVTFYDWWPTRRHTRYTSWWARNSRLWDETRIMCNCGKSQWDDDDYFI